MCLGLFAEAAVGRGKTRTVSLLGDPTHFLFTEKRCRVNELMGCRVRKLKDRDKVSNWSGWRNQFIGV